MVPMGTPGELWVRGYNVMLGYWNDEEKTREIIDRDGWAKTGQESVNFHVYTENPYNFFFSLSVYKMSVNTSLPGTTCKLQIQSTY